MNEVQEHLRKAVDEVSELLAALELDMTRDNVTKDTMGDAVRFRAEAIRRAIWEARWSLPAEVAP